MLKVLAEKAKGGDMTAIRIVLERVYPIRDGALADLLADIEELRAMIEARKVPDADTDMAGLLQEVEELRQQVRQGGIQ